MATFLKIGIGIFSFHVNTSNRSCIFWVFTMVLISAHTNNSQCTPVLISNELKKTLNLDPGKPLPFDVNRVKIITINVITRVDVYWF